MLTVRVAELITEKGHTVSARNTSRFARRVACELKGAGWTLDGSSATTPTSSRASSPPSRPSSAAHTRIHAGTPQTNGHVEARHKILDECWGPAFARHLYPTLTGLRRELDTYLTYYNTDRVHHGRLTRGRIPADIIHRAQKMEPR